jgi:tetratricopeptide (TPR) repeat protein
LASASATRGISTDALAQLVGAEPIYRRGTPPEAEYTFKHALVQDAAYDTLLRGRRQQLHAHIAAALEDRFPEIVAAQPALLAHHCTEAGLTEQAIAYWLAAGRQGLARSAATEAAALLRRGLALVPALPYSDRCRETELDLQIALGQALAASHTSWGSLELAAVNSRARELAAALNRPRALVSILFNQLWDHWARADLQRAQRLATEIRELGEATGDVVVQVVGCHCEGCIRFTFGEFAAGRERLEKALAFYDPAQRPAYAELLGLDGLVVMRMYLSLSLASLGHLDQAFVQHDAALGEARRLSHPLTLVMPLAVAGISGLRVCWGPGLLLQYADEMLALTTEHRLEHFRMWALIQRGWALTGLGRADEGIPLLAAGLGTFRDNAFVVFRPWALTLLADACRMAGQSHSALAHLAEARGLAEEKKYGFFRPRGFASPAKCCWRRAMLGRPRPATTRRLRSRNGSAPSSGNCAQPPASPGCGVTRASAPKPAICWRQSTAGSPRALARRSCRRRRRCSRSWHELPSVTSQGSHNVRP